MGDAVDEPLIPSNDSTVPEHLSGDDHGDVQVLNEGHIYDNDELKDRSHAATFVWALTFAAGLSGLLFGYDTGVISSTLVSIRSDLSSRELTTLDKGLITSCTSLFALVASPLAGVLADLMGRRQVIFVADVLFICGALWQAFTGSVWGMIGGRSIVGLAVGSASFVAPLYVSELAPSALRGRLVTVLVLLITGGQVVAYVVGWLLSSHASGWRYMVGLGALPAGAQIMILLFMPETPRWLVKAGRKTTAAAVLDRVYGRHQDNTEIVESILKRVEQEIIAEDAVTSSSISTLRDLWNIPGHRRALVIACVLQGGQQIIGFNALMYFSASIFAMVGFASPTLTALSVAVTNFAFTLVAFYAIDRVGRRRILLLSLPVMAAGLSLCAFGFGFINHSQSPAWPRTILVAMVIYVAGYGVGIGNVPWQQAELFSLRVRALGAGIATAVNWAMNFVVGLTFLPLMASITSSGTFALYAGICVAVWATVYCIYPETAGLSLEDVGGLLRDGWGVRDSIQRWHERRKIRMLHE